MLPTLRQRSLMLAAMVGGGWLFGYAGGQVLEASPIETMVLLGSDEPVAAMLWIIGAAVVVGIFAAVCGATGHRVAGPFVLTTAMIGAAVAGGPIDSFLIAAIEPSAHLRLALEAAVLAIVLLFAFVGMAAGRTMIRRRFRLQSGSASETASETPSETTPWTRAAATIAVAWVVSAVLLGLLLGTRTATAYAISILVGLPAVALIYLAVIALGRLGLADSRDTRGEREVDHLNQLGAGALMMILGGAIAVLLLRRVETGQMVGGLLLSFGLAAWGTERMLPGGARWMLLLSPLGLAIGAYCWVAWGLPEGVTLWQAFTSQRDPMLKLGAIPPLFYCSAGVAGVAIGLGLIDSVRSHQAAVSGSDEAKDRVETQPKTTVSS